MESLWNPLLQWAQNMLAGNGGWMEYLAVGIGVFIAADIPKIKAVGTGLADTWRAFPVIMRTWRQIMADGVITEDEAKLLAADGLSLAKNFAVALIAFVYAIGGILKGIPGVGRFFGWLGVKRTK